MTRKPQAIRLLDVFVIGPLMIVGARHAQTMSPQARWWLKLFGVSTIVYNGYNFLRDA